MSGLIMAAGIAALLAAAPAFAATWTWTGGAGNNHWTNTRELEPAHGAGERWHGGHHFRRHDPADARHERNLERQSVTFNNIAGPFSLASTAGTTLTVGAGGITD